MASLEIRNVGVIGAGTMGAGIAQLLAQSGFNVRLTDVSDEALTKAEGKILAGLQKTGKPEALSRVLKTTRFEEMAECDLVIEAAIEAFGIKQDIFRRLDSLLDPSKLLATNTSSLSLHSLTAQLKYPGRAFGLHFFNPAVVMKLVEVVRGPSTSEETAKQGLAFARKLGKTPVLCKDTPGFIANRVARPFYLAGMRLLERGAGTPADIDAAVRTQGKFKMGPLELIDLIGLEVNLSISRVIYEALGRPERLKPCETQAQLVARHCLGRKTARGFYCYDADSPTVNPVLNELLPKMGSKPLEPKKIFSDILENVVEEARRAAKEGVASEDDIDTAMRLGLNWPKGPLEWGKEFLRRS